MRPEPRILEFATTRNASKRAAEDSNMVIEFSRGRMAAALRPITTSEARERRHRERHERKKAA